jgi:hypothetical protein
MWERSYWELFKGAIARSGQSSVANLLPLLRSCETREGVVCGFIWSNRCSAFSWELARCARPSGHGSIGIEGSDRQSQT